MKRRTFIADKSAIVTLDECRRMAHADFYNKQNSHDAILAEKYFLANQAAYYVLTNTWFKMIDEYCSQDTWAEILYTCQVQGLFYEIEAASDLSDSVVATLSTTEVQPTEDAKLVIAVDPGSVWDPWLGVCQAVLGDEWYDHVPDLLQILRYPKRFSPSKLTALEEVCIQDFLNVLNYNRNRSLREGSYYMNLQVRSIIEEFLPYADEIITSILSGKACTYRSNYDGKWYTFHPEDYVGEFSPGSTVETTSDVLAKMDWLSWHTGTYRGMPFPADLQSSDSEYLREPCMPWDPRNEFLSDTYYNRSVALYYSVPKNYKKARGIAAEEVYRQMAAKGFGDLLYDIFHNLSKFRNCYTRDDQTGQQELMERGSRFRLFGSGDLSSASDTVLWTQVETWFPKSVVRIMRTLRSTWVMMPSGKVCLTQMAFTSGHTLTFFTESMVFGAILELASRWTELFTVDTNLSEKGLHLLYSKHDVAKNNQQRWGIYGDDCAIAAEAWPLMIELLEFFGFKVNTSKSFCGIYTEACGCEYFDGREVSSKYWPRKTLPGLRDEISPAGLSSLIDLQHRLFRHKSAALFLAWYVRDFLPDMTMSFPGTDCTDLWSNTPRELFFTYSFEFDERRETWKEVPVNLNYRGHYCSEVKSNKRPINDGDYVAVERIVNRHGYFREMAIGVSREKALALLDFKAYVDFLLDGPVYNTELDRMLRVSVKRDRYKALKLETLTFVPRFKA